MFILVYLHHFYRVKLLQVQELLKFGFGLLREQYGVRQQNIDISSMFQNFILILITFVDVLTVFGARRAVVADVVYKMKLATFKESSFKKRISESQPITVVEIFPNVYALLDGQHRTICDGRQVYAEIWPLYTPYRLLKLIRLTYSSRKDNTAHDSIFHRASICYSCWFDFKISKKDVRAKLVASGEHCKKYHNAF